MSNKERTKGEWFSIYEDGNFYIVENPKYHLEIVQIDHEPDKSEIARDSSISYRSFEEREANAEFICLAVNNHDALLEACNSALSFMSKAIDAEHYRAIIDGVAVKEQLEQAIRQARGEE